jgi:putative ABC transport system permease protein
MFLAIRELRFAKGRFALMGSVVALITMLVVLLSGLTAGLASQNVSAIRALPASHFAFSSPPAGDAPSFSDSRIDGAQLDAWRQTPGVVWATPLAISQTRMSTGDREVAVAVFAAPPGSRAAPTSLHAGGIVINQELAAKEALHVGAQVQVAGSSFTVAGTVGDAWFSHMPVVWVPLAEWSRIPDSGFKPGQVASVLALGLDSGSALGANEVVSGTVSKSRGGSLSAIGSYEAENGSLSLMRLLLFAISALVVGAYFTVWTIQRTHDLAVLKAMGVSSSNLVIDAMAQAFAVLLLGGLVGTALATGAGVVAARTVPLVIDAATTAIPLAVMVAVGMAGAALAVRRVTSVDPLIALGASR